VILQDQHENRQRFIWWNGGDAPLPEANFDLACKLSQSDYRGSPQVSAEWVDFRLSETGKRIVAQREFEIIDERACTDPIQTLQEINNQYEQVLVWGEGDLPDEVIAVSRRDLKTAETLVIWTAPPAQSVLQEAIFQVKPDRMILFGIDPHLDSYKAFIHRLGGMVKYTLRHKHGEATLTDLAAACADKEETVRVGLLLWEAMGKVTVEFKEESMVIRPNQEVVDTSGIEIYRSILTALLEESQAYRHYFRTAAIESIFRHS
jgi:hypothetical protein